MRVLPLRHLPGPGYSDESSRDAHHVMLGWDACPSS
eukprot:SAG11_NODE_1074_length_5968_cov_2.041063_12_plen_36_part_00